MSELNSTHKISVEYSFKFLGKYNKAQKMQNKQAVLSVSKLVNSGLPKDV